MEDAHANETAAQTTEDLAGVEHAVDALADLVVEAIEQSLNASDGKTMHLERCDHPDLIGCVECDRTES